MKRTVKSIFYWVLIILLVISGPAWVFIGELYIVPRWGTENILVAIKQIERGEVVTSDHFALVPVKKEQVVEGAVKDQSKLLNKEALQLIHVNQQITEDLINTKHLYPNKDEYNMPLPTEWIFGKVPGSLLRGDKVTLSLVKKAETTSINNQDEIMGSNPIDSGLSEEEELLLQGIIVSYVKASNNKEVQSPDDRKNPTAAVSNVELIVTEKQKDLIARLGSAGYKFIVAYR